MIGERRCRVCGCADLHACPGGCYWVEPDLCSACAGKEAVKRVVEQIKPLLAGRPPEFQGVVLADLLALWLAGHLVPGDAAATLQMRAELLAEHLELVQALVAENGQMLGTALH